MTAPSLNDSWPFPGVVWGEYPERKPDQLPARQDIPRLSLTRLRKFAQQVLAQSTASAADAAAKRGAPQLADLFARAAQAIADTQGFTPHLHQVMAARAMLDDQLVEMPTGDGKTVAIAMAAAVAALCRTPVHVVTANDYLAQRDAEDLAPFYAQLGLRCAHVTQPLNALARRTAYACHVTYCTAKELAFDFLRDGLGRAADLSPLEHRARRLGQPGQAEPPVLRGLCMALIDEADTVLLDEARMPLVLSRPDGGPQEWAFYRAALALAAGLEEGADFQRSPDGRRILVAPAAWRKLREWPATDHPLLAHALHRQAAVTQALMALHVLQRDRDYVVRGGEVMLVDETTGRAAPGRAWSQGLHQCVELKEELATTQRNATLTQTTYQQFFPRYLRLGGMSGTLRGAGRELRTLYGLRMVSLPPRIPSQVKRMPLSMLPDSRSLWEAVARQAAAVQETGRPVLIGTESVAQSEALSAVLAARGMAHQVLNARQDAREHQVVAQAGQPGRITVATSMAGRGTDIALSPEVTQKGGLHVILCQNNASARIDRQFLGRAARQGQPGSSQVMLALDFPLIQRWLPIWWLTIVKKAHFAAPLVWMTAHWGQRLEGYTQMQQRVTLRRAAQTETQELTFSRRMYS